MEHHACINLTFFKKNKGINLNFYEIIFYIFEMNLLGLINIIANTLENIGLILKCKS